jgi:hypothetical protein
VSEQYLVLSHCCEGVTRFVSGRAPSIPESSRIARVEILVIIIMYGSAPAYIISVVSSQSTSESQGTNYPLKRLAKFPETTKIVPESSLCPKNSMAASAIQTSRAPAPATRLAHDLASAPSKAFSGGLQFRQAQPKSSSTPIPPSTPSSTSLSGATYGSSGMMKDSSAPASA